MRRRSEAATRGVTLSPKPEARGSRQEELPHAPKPKTRGDGWEELPHAHTPPRQRPRVAARRSNPMPKARGSGREDQPHGQRAVAVRAHEGLEELSQVEGQEGWW